MKLISDATISRIFDEDMPVRKKYAKRKATTSISMPGDIYASVKFCATDLDLTQSELMSEAIATYGKLLMNKDFQKVLANADSVYEAVITLMNGHNDVNHSEVKHSEVKHSEVVVRTISSSKKNNSKRRRMLVR